MSSVKVSFENEVRRVIIGDDKLSYQFLLASLKELFPKLGNKSFVLLWQDEEGDYITASSDVELKEAVRVLKASKSTLLRFYVKVLSEDQQSIPQAAPMGVEQNSEVVHEHVTCDECGMSPIRGMRYKCTVRDDFDLCAGCERKKAQPYPMMKIYDPTQSPAALFYAFRDGEERRGGGGWRGRWRRGCRVDGPEHPMGGFPHGHFPHHGPPHGLHGGPHGGPHHSPHGPHHGPHGGFFGGFRGGCRPDNAEAAAASGDNKEDEKLNRKAEKLTRRLGHLGGKLEKINALRGQPCFAPFIHAVDAFVTSVQEQEAEGEAQGEAIEVAASNNEEQQQMEEQLLQEAIQESLSFNDSKNAMEQQQEEEEMVMGTASASASASASVTSAVTHVPTANPAVSSLPKPALRFVKDVSYPDGTMVPPGAVFLKVWHIRNDGTQAWPEGAVLVPAGGDMMSATPGEKIALPAVKANEEVNLAVKLKAPQVPGLYTAYFRAQTKDQQAFGHRLWAAVLVADEDEWQVVNQKPSPVAPAAPVAAVVAKERIPVAVVMEKAEMTLEQTGLPVAPVPISPPAPVPISPPAPVPTSPPAPVPTSPPAPVPTSPPAAAPMPPVAPAPAEKNNAKAISFLWRKELETLSEMGFVESEAIIPLLQQHLVTPVSLLSDRNAAPNVEGMQRIVATLLGM